MIINGKKVICGSCGCGCRCCEKSNPCTCGSCKNNPSHPDYSKFKEFTDKIEKGEL